MSGLYSLKYVLVDIHHSSSFNLKNYQKKYKIDYFCVASNAKKCFILFCLSKIHLTNTKSMTSIQIQMLRVFAHSYWAANQEQSSATYPSGSYITIKPLQLFWQVLPNELLGKTTIVVSIFYPDV